MRHGPIRVAIRVVATLALLAFAGTVDILTGPQVHAAFFAFLPIIAACAWFGAWGVLIVPATFLLYEYIRWTEWRRPPLVLTTNDVVDLLSFTLVAALALLARERYRMVREARDSQAALRREAEDRGTHLESLYRVARAANASRGTQEFLEVLLDELVHLVPHVRVATILERQGDVLVRRAARGPLHPGAIGERVPVGEGVAGGVAASGQSLVLQGPAFSLDAVASARVRAARPESAVAVPLRLKDETKGVIVLFGEPGSNFTPEDVRTLESMGIEAALVLESLQLYESLRESNVALRERQRRLDEQLRFAREVQHAILSVCPARCRIGPLEMASFHRSAWEVGGDFLRIIPGDDGVALFVGDVMGKGVPAALLMTMMTAELSSRGARAADPTATLREANRALIYNIADLDAAGFVTVFYAFITAADLCLRYASAGHPPAVLARKDGSVTLLEAQDPPLGILTKTEPPTSERTLAPGDRLVVYTDGLVDARSPSRELFGIERLCDVVVRHRSGTVGELQTAIVAALQEFGGSARPADDLALIVLGVRGA
ncbi:MAG: SpoIIE family protein phosphatase [Armatimonadetes bacterium]|nr:SpoIIE family protein phosphatase [Armatimonadota bacterium]